jgi:hypothetical protein
MSFLITQARLAMRSLIKLDTMWCWNVNLGSSLMNHVVVITDEGRATTIGRLAQEWFGRSPFSMVLAVTVLIHQP